MVVINRFLGCKDKKKSRITPFKLSLFIFFSLQRQAKRSHFLYETVLALFYLTCRMDCNIFGNRKKSGDTFVMIFLSNSLSRNVVEIEREKWLFRNLE